MHAHAAIKLTSRSIGKVVTIGRMEPNTTYIRLCREGVATLRTIGRPQFNCGGEGGGGKEEVVHFNTLNTISIIITCAII